MVMGVVDFILKHPHSLQMWIFKYLQEDLLWCWKGRWWCDYWIWFLNSHTISQCEYSSTFKKIYLYVEKGDVSSGYGSMNNHTYLYHNGFELFMNDSNSIDTDINDTLQNGHMSSWIGLLNSHTLLQDNESSKPNEKNMSVDNGYVNGNYFYINSSTGYIIKNHNYIDYTQIRY